MATLGWRLGRMAVAVAAALALMVLASPTPARAVTLNCSNKWPLWTSFSANQYVWAELGYTGGNYAMLRAAHAAPGTGTEWTFCSYYEGPTKVHAILDTRNNRWVTMEKNYTGGSYGMLRARGTKILAWQKFSIQRWGPNPSMYTIKSLANNRYVTTEMNYTGNSRYMLRARGTKILAWQKFIIPCGFPFICSI